MSRLAEFGFAAAAILGFAGAAGAAPADDFLKCATIAQAEARLVCYDKAAADMGAVAGAPSAMAAPQVAEAPQAMAPAPKPKKKGGAFFGLFGHKDALATETPSAPAAAPVTAPATNSNEIAMAQASTAPAATPPTATDKFGADDLPKLQTEKQKEERIDKLRSPVDEYAFTPYGKLIVFLNNGQVWRQLQSDDTKFHLRKGKTYTAVLSRGMLGSYNLSFEGVDDMAKVQRIK